MATNQFKVRSTSPSNLTIPFIRLDTQSSVRRYLQKTFKNLVDLSWCERTFYR